MRHWLVAVLAAAALAPMRTAAQSLVSDFTTGPGAAPPGWSLAEGKGVWTPAGAGAKRALTVSGSGDDQAYWAARGVKMEAGATYRFRFRARGTTAAYTVIAGLDVCNRDFQATTDWADHSFVFTVPGGAASAFARLGQWHYPGTVSFASASIRSVAPIHRRYGSLVLGAGESVAASMYRFQAPLSGDGSNSARCLVSHTAAFNSNRWVFTGGSSVIYRHDAGSAPLRSASVAVNVNYRTGGVCVVSASSDGIAWRDLGRLDAVGAAKLAVPADLLPAKAVWVRIAGADARDAAGNSAPGAFQVDDYSFRGELAGGLPDAEGGTTYVETLQSDPSLSVRLDDLGSFGRDGGDVLAATLRPGSGWNGEATLAVTLTGEDGKPRGPYYQTATLRPGRPSALSVQYRWTTTGRVRADISVTSRAVSTGARRVYHATAEEFVPAYYDTSYGYSLTPVAAGDLWWCEAGHKIRPTRLPPIQTYQVGAADIRAVRAQGALALRAARGEREHVQLVFRPTSATGPISVSATDLAGAGGVLIPKSAVEIREVAYVRVANPSDRTGVAGEWPDPLAPLSGAWTPAVDRNNPLWITVTVPQSARAGDYTGWVRLQAGGWTREIALKLHVWAFGLPARTALRSGFGVSPYNIRRYHNLKSPQSNSRVWDLYMQEFAKRRISPYNPMALAPYEAKLVGGTWIGGKRDLSERSTGRASRKIVDSSVSAVVSAESAEMFPMARGQSYVLKWKCKSELPGQVVHVTVSQYDQARNWIPNHNIDIHRTADGKWQDFEDDLGARITEWTAYGKVSLRPAPWSEKGEQTGTAWFDDVRLLRQSDGVDLIVDGGFEAEGEWRLSLDFAEFDKAAARYLDELGFNSFTVAIPGLGGGRHPNYDNGNLLGAPAGSPEYDRLMTEYGRQLESHLAEKGWLDRAYVYWYDEPETNDYPFVVEGSRKLARYFPRCRRMLTEEFQPALFGHVQLWCPITPNYQEEAARARQKLGEEVWWYVCTGPREPYCTLFIDHPGIEMRMWLWQTWKYKVQGILIWETTWWTTDDKFVDRLQNPWEDPMSYVAGAPGFWGNGDGRFYYPPNRKPNDDKQTEFVQPPVIAMRWELLADGIEDWEYFRLLDERVRKAEASGDSRPVVRRARALLTIPPTVCADMTHFTTSPALLDDYRAKVAAAIESLGAP